MPHLRFNWFTYSTCLLLLIESKAVSPHSQAPDFRFSLKKFFKDGFRCIIDESYLLYYTRVVKYTWDKTYHPNYFQAGSYRVLGAFSLLCSHLESLSPCWYSGHCLCSSSPWRISSNTANCSQCTWPLFPPVLVWLCRSSISQALCPHIIGTCPPCSLSTSWFWYSHFEVTILLIWWASEQNEISPLNNSLDAVGQRLHFREPRLFWQKKQPQVSAS